MPLRSVSHNSSLRKTGGGQVRRNELQSKNERDWGTNQSRWMRQSDWERNRRRMNKEGEWLREKSISLSLTPLRPKVETRALILSIIWPLFGPSSFSHYFDFFKSNSEYLIGYWVANIPTWYLPRSIYQVPEPADTCFLKNYLIQLGITGMGQVGFWVTGPNCSPCFFI